MILSIIQFGLLIGSYIIQSNLPLFAEDKTMISYFFPFFIIIFRLLFFLKLLGIPIPKNVAAYGELVMFFLGMVLMIMTSYNKGYTFNIINMCIVFIITMVTVVAEILNETFVHTILVAVDENEKEI